jgi:predicted ATPase
MIDKNEKKKIHLKIGRFLLEGYSKNERDENIFQIVDQMNIGYDLILKPSEKKELARLNLSAVKKAILSIAYESALQYIRMAAELLEDECWKINYTLAFVVYVERAGLEQLNGNFEKAEEIIKLILRNVDNVNDKTIAYSLLIKQITIQQRYGESLKIAKEALAQLDVKLPESNYDIAWEAEYKIIISLLGDRDVMSLLELPEIVIPEKKHIIDFLFDLIALTYQFVPELFPVVNAKIVRFSLRYGNTVGSCEGYSCFGFGSID